MYEIGPYSPFPSSLRGEPKVGAFCEIFLDNGKTSQYVIIRSKAYLTDRMQEIVAKGYQTLEEAYPEIALMERPPKDGTRWLYRLETFKVAREFHDNQDNFVTHTTEYEQWCFDDFNELMNFCEHKFHVAINDFRKDWETNYPQS